ncbi:gastric inhibitory polypeptide receptor [Microcaecilia unicolor]|uniref:Gastric inhibitory polypeptide receptor n=1 Tax=Microcaecilia unicolor TaxID=1415580 RepID=A0A6P7ZNN3_9AMPH|nr:gastric inhibitory polypeptide receptor [Microcaecilia unicolor]
MQGHWKRSDSSQAFSISDGEELKLLPAAAVPESPSWTCSHLPPCHWYTWKMCCTLLLLSVLFPRNAESSAAKKFKDIYNDWTKYQLDCEKNMTRNPYPTGIFCNRTFDMYACWEDGLPNTTVKVPCPSYLPWQDQVKDGFVLRKCDPDGQWVMDELGGPWRDHSQCEKKEDEEDAYSQMRMRILEHFQQMYTVGYSLSLAALTLAIFMLLAFRKLRCTRNYIHMNLFVSFMLRALSILTRDKLLKIHLRRAIHDNGDFYHLVSDEATIGCRLTQVLTQYCVVANYYWLLVEGLYLHNLLVMAFSEETYFPGYLLLGWGAPVLFVVPWVIVRYLYENTACWETNDNMAYWWIIRCPILLALLINFFIFIRIIKIIISKLRAHQMRYTDYTFRLAKSTLALISLLGIHEVVIAVVPEEQAKGTLRYVKLFYELLLSSFQGLLVSVLYCFINKEVQAEIRKKWQLCQLDTNLLEKYQKPSTSNVCYPQERSQRYDNVDYSSENSSSSQNQHPNPETVAILGKKHSLV